MTVAKEDINDTLRRMGNQGVVDRHDNAHKFSNALDRIPRTDKPLISAKPFVLRDPKSIPRRRWVYGKHLIRKFGSATSAPSGSGKSNLFIVEGLAMETDRPLLGIKPGQRLSGLALKRHEDLFN